MVITNIEQLSRDSGHRQIDISNIKMDLFGDPLDKSQPLWLVSKQSRVSCYLKEMLSTVCTVLTRQYKTYLGLSDEMKEKMAKETGNILQFIYTYILNICVMSTVYY